jgi:hypothetical protein
MASFLTDLKRKLGVQQPRQAWDEQVPNNLQSVAQPNPTPQIQQTYSQNINPTVAQVQPAPVDQTVATRPRSVMNNVRNAVSQPQHQVAPQQVQQAPTPTLDTGATRDRRTQPRDYIADDEAALRQLQNQKDPFWKRAVIAGINAGQAGFGYQPTPIQTGRMRDMAKLQGQLGSEIKTSEARQKIEQGDLVPFQLPDGTWSVAPRKNIGGLQSRQQIATQGQSIRKQQLEEYKGRHAQMAKHEAMQDAQRKYNSGIADGNDDLKEEMARELGLPEGTRLPDHDKGQIVTDANGNYGVASARTKTFSPLTQPSDTGRPRTVGSFQKTKADADAAAKAAALAEKAREFDLKPKPVGRGAGAAKISQKDRDTGRELWTKLNNNTNRLNEIDNEIRQVNDMSEDDAKKKYDPQNTAGVIEKDSDGKPITPEFNKNEYIKNQVLRRLGQEQKNLVDTNKKAVTGTDMLPSDYDFQVDERGRAKRIPRGAAPSDLDKPIYGTPTTPKGGGQPWSASRWLKANPNGNVEAAKKAAGLAGYRVVQ